MGTCFARITCSESWGKECWMSITGKLLNIECDEQNSQLGLEENIQSSSLPVVIGRVKQT